MDCSVYEQSECLVFNSLFLKDRAWGIRGRLGKVPCNFPQPYLIFTGYGYEINSCGKILPTRHVATAGKLRYAESSAGISKKSGVLVERTEENGV